MVKLLVIFVVAHLVELFELAGVALIVFGLSLAWGAPAAVIGGGVFLLLKAFEMDMSAKGET